MPAGLTIPIGNKYYDWMYRSEPEPFMHNRRIDHGRGKILGGSSSINGMIFQRGNPLDYEKWGAYAGMESGTMPTVCPTSNGWKFVWLVPMTFVAVMGRWFLNVARHQSPFSGFFSSVQQAGHPLTDDVNGQQQEGFAKFDRNFHKGRDSVQPEPICIR